jgi:hypothetical protein
MSHLANAIRRPGLRSSGHRLLALCLAAGIELPGLAAAPAAPAGPGPAFKLVSPSVFALGKVLLDKTNRTVSFPALVNMTEAIVEYAVVTPGGKTHESLLRTEAEPHHIHVAMLLLNAATAGFDSFPTNAARPLPGERIRVELAWAAGGRTNRAPVESWLLNRKTRSPMADCDWVYNGSRAMAGVFLAQRDGSVVSLIADPDALVNNGRSDRDDDELWEVNSARVPPLDTPVTVSFQLSSAPSGPSPGPDRKK